MIAIVLLIAALPLMAIVAAAIACTSRGPILFRHERVGRNARRFAMLKFRTMRDRAEGPAVTRRGDARITPVGALLRRTKLDELPELWNVVRGDMSLVGPRPEAPVFVDSRNAAWSAVLRARPGITDPTTVLLRNEEALLGTVGADHEAFYRRYIVPYKLQHYQEYLDRRTWRRDLAVLQQTLLAVVLPARVPPPTPDAIVAALDERRLA